MLRRTLTILSLIGLLLSVGLWGVSFYGFSYTNSSFFAGPHLLVCGAKESLFVEWKDITNLWPSHPRDMRLERLEFGARARAMHGIKTTYLRSLLPSVYTNWGVKYVNLPFWFLTLVSVVLPGRAFVFHRRHRKREKLGMCVKCGYDLRGSKERCPECGARFETPKLGFDC